MKALLELLKDRLSSLAHTAREVHPPTGMVLGTRKGRVLAATLRSKQSTEVGILVLQRQSRHMLDYQDHLILILQNWSTNL